MIPIRIVETERAGFEGPVVELWRDDEFVGQVFWDGETSIVQIYPTEEGDVHDLDLTDLTRVLDTALAIIDPTAFDDALDEELAGLRMATRVALGEDDGEGWEDEDPATLTLVGEFDQRAVHRTDEGEGFFPADVAEEFIRRCEELGLAVVEMEGFDLDRATLHPRPGEDLEVPAQDVMVWSDFHSYANAMALDVLGGWTGGSLVVAFVVKQPNGETFVA